jgi:hypothetical protein
MITRWWLLLLPLLVAVDTDTADNDGSDKHQKAACKDPAKQYCLVKLFRVALSTFPQRHARAFVDDSLIRSSSFHFSCYPDIFSPWVKARLVLQ